MRTATFTFYPDLNDFLPPPRRTGRFACDFEPGQSLKHLVEAAGVPHTELGRVEVNGQPAALDQLLADGDQVQAWRATDQNGTRPACGQIYWKGSHYEQMQTLVQQISGGGYD